MGIQGLLPTLKSIMNPRHVRDYAGKRAAVDTYSWLHKAAFGCSRDMCLGLPSDKYIGYCMNRVNMLRHYGVEPVLVFDGGGLPMKSDQELKRARSRKENFDRAVEHERSGNQSAAYDCYQKAVDVTPAMAFRLIQVLRQEHVDYVVAPYEADAQMAFLARNGHVDLVITEDSDLIAYGCPQIFFKMDKYGQGVGFQFSDIVTNKDVDFNNFSERMVLEMCIMSGCDYLSSLPGMGVKKAHGFIKRFNTYQKVIKHLKFSGFVIDTLYEQGFERALLTFQHHRVYDPAKREMVHLTDVPIGLDADLDFLGPYVSQTIAVAVARGEVDPTTYEPFEDTSNSGTPCTASNAQVQRASPDLRVKPSPPNSALISSFFQEPRESVKNQFRRPRNSPDNAPSQLQASQEAGPSQFTPSPTITSQTYSSPFSKFSFSSSPIFVTPPSQVSPFVSEELDFDEELPRVTDLTSDYPPAEHPQTRTLGFPACAEEKRKDRSPSPFAMGRSLFPSKPLEEKAPKTPSVPPPLRSAVVQLTASSTKLRVEATCPGASVKRSAYFSQASPAKAHPPGPVASLEEPLQTKSNAADVLEMSESRSPSDLPDTQNSEAAGIETRALEEFHHVPCCRDVSTETLMDITNKRQPDPISAGKRKHIPQFRSDLLGERPAKGRSFSSVSHVGQYSGLAQRSMDDFVSTLAPFRCTQSGPGASANPAPSKPGSRASGLRAPSKSAQKTSSSRGALSSGLTKKISDFVYSSPVNLRRQTFPETTSVAAGALRWQDYNEADWERA